MLNLLTVAHASDNVTASTASFNFMSMMPIVAIFAIMYFFMIRPQQKKIQEHKAMVDALKVNDYVVTSGGISGTVTKLVNDNEVKVLIAPNIEVNVMRNAIILVTNRVSTDKLQNSDNLKIDTDLNQPQELDVQTKKIQTKKISVTPPLKKTKPIVKSSKSSSKIFK